MGGRPSNLTSQAQGHYYRSQDLITPVMPVREIYDCTWCPKKNDTLSVSYNFRLNDQNTTFQAKMKCHLNLEHYAENRVQFG